MCKKKLIFFWCRLSVHRFLFFLVYSFALLRWAHYMTHMNLILAFAALDAGSPRQRARCAKTGRFVAWSKAAPLRRAVAGQVLFVPQAPLSTEVEVAEVEAPLVGGVDTAAAAPVGGGVAVATAGAGAVALVAAAGRSAAAAVRTLAARLAGAGRRLVAGLLGKVAPRRGEVTVD